MGGRPRGLRVDPGSRFRAGVRPHPGPGSRAGTRTGRGRRRARLRPRRPSRPRAARLRAGAALRRAARRARPRVLRLRLLPQHEQELSGAGRARGHRPRQAARGRVGRCLGGVRAAHVRRQGHLPPALHARRRRHARRGEPAPQQPRPLEAVVRQLHRFGGPLGRLRIALPRARGVRLPRHLGPVPRRAGGEGPRRGLGRGRGHPRRRAPPPHPEELHHHDLLPPEAGGEGARVVGRAVRGLQHQPRRPPLR